MLTCAVFSLEAWVAVTRKQARVTLHAGAVSRALSGKTLINVCGAVLSRIPRGTGTREVSYHVLQVLNTIFIGGPQWYVTMTSLHARAGPTSNLATQREKNDQL